MEVRRQQALAEVAKSQVKGVKALADLALERQIKGASAKSDAVQAQSRVESAQATAINYEAQAQRWRVRLMYLTGLKELPSIGGELPGALPQACAAANGPEALPPAAVLKAMGQRELAKADLKAADAQLKPTLSLNGSVARGLNSNSRPAGYGEFDTRVSVNFSAPLYEGGA